MKFIFINKLKIYSITILSIAVWNTSSSFGQIANLNPDQLQKIDVDEQLGEKIPLDLEFINSEGQSFRFADYFQQEKPVILVLAYYNCPMLCTLVLNGLVDAANKTSLSPSEDYNIITVSIDPAETPELAKAKKQTYVKSFDRDNVAAGWIFSVGQQASIERVARAIGFKYYWDEKQEQWAHPAVLTLLTPDGRISRYLYGIEFKPNDIKLGLLEASKGKIGSTLDKIILYCYHYDPDAEGYVVFANNLMKIGGIATAFFILIFLGILWTKEHIIRK